jgi:peptidyl-prolyl cis-trans isomerase C
MKRTVAVLLFVCLAAACRKPAPTTSASTASTTAPAPAASASPAAAAAPGALETPPAAKPLPAKLPDVLAKVNGESIERWELENAVKGVEGRAGQPIPADRRDAAVRDILNQIVDYHLMAQESRSRKIEVSDAEITARLAQIRQQFPTEDAYKQALSAQGMSPDQLTRQTRMALQVQKVVDAEIASKISVQDSDVNAFYQQNVDKFKQGETVHASHILIGVPQNATPAQKQQAKAVADKVLKQVKAGGDFAKLAKENSQDPGSAPNGGDLGYFPKGQMDPAFEKAAFALKPGAVSGVVETPFGYHIIKVVDRKPAHTAELNEVSPRIKEFLSQQQREQKLEEFVKQARSKAKIDILV